MSYTIRHVEKDGFHLVNLTDENNATTVTLLPGYGASLHEFRIRQKDGSFFNVIDNYRDRTDLEKEMTRTFKGPKLSPYPCRIADGIYHFKGREYRFGHLFPDGNAIHGLLYDKPFAVTAENIDGAAMVSMEYAYDNEDPGYPFHYRCLVRYELHPGSDLEVTTTVTNISDTVIPIADGWHPYFRLGGRANDWSLQFHSEAIVDFDHRLVPTGGLTQYDQFATLRPLGDTFLDNCFVLKPELAGPACELYNPANDLRISFFPDSGYPYLQIYTPPTRDSIAVENLSSAPDCFNNQMGLLLLQPGHSQIFTVRFKVSID
jgi:aldose 1-epimerase